MKRFFFLAAAAAMTLFGCAKNEAPDGPQDPQAVRFSVANVGTYQMKAPTAAIGETGGSSVGIYAPGLNNAFVESTVSGTALTPSSTIYWGVGQTSASTFYARYPYANEAAATTLTYELPANQSSEDTFTYQNNLMTAVQSASPSDASVAFNFTHPFAKMIININNQNAGGDIVTSVVVKGLKLAASLDLTTAPATVALGADASDMTAYPVNTASQNALQYALVVAPQAGVTPQIVVTTALGSIYNFTIATAYSFEAGKVATTAGSITLAAVSGGASGVQRNEVSAYSFSTTDWSNATINPDAPTPGAVTMAEYWNVIGTVYGSDASAEAWANDFPMTYGADGKWSITINYDESKAGAGQGVGFKLRKFNENTADKWANQLGFYSSTADDYTIASGGDYGLSDAGDSKNIRLASSGSWTLVLDGVSLVATKN